MPLIFTIMKIFTLFISGPATELSSLEKLIYPLSFYTWVCVISCFAFGYAVIFVTKLQTKSFQNFIFGRLVTHPYLNIWIAILGTTQHKLPSRNFARYLLMIFLLNSLIIRSGYQGKMFDLMQSDMKHSEPQTINQMVERDFEFYVSDIYIDLINKYSGSM